MKAESSLPHSQEPATCPNPEPDESSPCTNMLSCEDLANSYSNRYSEQNVR
jgi:hypothetical protein